MPARTNGSATTAKRFELPALDFKFASLTEGTGIPPPAPSPTEEKMPALKLGEKKAIRGEALSNSANTSSSKTIGAQSSTTAISNTQTSPSRTLVRAGVKRSADDVPASPTLSSRPGSIRRLFSRNLLNTAYANAESEGPPASPDSAVAPGSIVRPESRSDISIMDERKARRSSGWFRRLRGAEAGYTGANGSVAPSSPLSKRSSVLFEEERKPLGPPPP